MTTDHPSDAGWQLQQSLNAIHQKNTGRPIRCLDCGVVFIGADNAIRYFSHVANGHGGEAR